MKNITFLFLFMTQLALAQKQEFITMYAGINSTYTLEDVTKGNNPWAIGGFVSAYANTGGWLRPTMEITADAFIKDNGVNVHDGADGIVPRIDAMFCLMGGAAIRFENFLSIGCVTGPAFLTTDDRSTGLITNKRLWVIKPNIDITPGKGKFTFRIGYVKASSRFKSSSPTRYKALTLGVGVRLIGK